MNSYNKSMQDQERYEQEKEMRRLQIERLREERCRLRKSPLLGLLEPLTLERPEEFLRCRGRCHRERWERGLEENRLRPSRRSDVSRAQHDGHRDS